MPQAPELGKMPELIKSFVKTGLAPELLMEFVKGRKGRDIVEDAKNFLKELDKDTKINVYGQENIPKETGCLMVFNHPNIDVLVPAMLTMFVEINKETGHQVRIAIGAEIPKSANEKGEKTAVTGSMWFLNRFFGIYSNNIIPIPTLEDRADYTMGRAMAVKKMVRAFRNKDIVIISPEGHVEEENTICPLGTYHHGAGKLAVTARHLGIPTVPIAMWPKDKHNVELVIGEPFWVESDEAELASTQEMFEIAKLMPEELRGPFK